MVLKQVDKLMLTRADMCIFTLGVQELMEAESRPSSEGSRRKRRLPKGMSDYQAAWITEEDLGDLEEESDSGIEEEDGQVHDRQGGDAEPRFGMDGAVSMADLEEEDDQTDDMQVRGNVTFEKETQVTFATIVGMMSTKV